MQRILIAADLHCGHRIGLCPPKHQPKVNPGAPHPVQKLSNEREAMWKWFAKSVGELRPINTLIVNGDAVEGKGDRSGGTELLTTDREEQAAIAADAINFVRAGEVYATYGTPYHVSADGEDWENVVYKGVENFRKLESEGHYSLKCGLEIVCKHYIGNTSSIASRGTALCNAQAKQVWWSLRGQQKICNLLVRSHVHRSFAIQDPAANFIALTTPALQGAGSKYGARQCDGLPVDFGFVVVDVVDLHEWAVDFRIAPASYAQSSVTRI